ncbi:hypothetical protein A3C21_01185 [Candidatus Kaiserbacteria bacterium RIFCSPHIGHO2_02_FULL_59_21]|uniref:Ribonuclease VapC n=1 Tax=Candidatus Kaiserbacteria bacterium RIFCSPHIGHO2_02_FULL_59_21 TaxID=1798500 RepID=A0A1F6E1H9_9BACT|nr:MAG: hypothetical protein A2766_01915 [Candidatus Kaiserbacteria bacterium RIFCSPHIGHO2_01_FULL_58_22]OGG67410.1 MAG: hypothetical protein A3C21_01185 [Candidatus Kaiserbacteria bacterium RIFCSPHIGHO2_02_FULL_59_21]OGG80259.1 MAG: hypothetical protein A2952_01820 [Candidatus Kaiserbacteria bacterium RIFCSPLOWO2_01_FULL_59_34]OGG85786.1 MAG: hypothetical protein A3I47_00100 [Candidatus Kaiserbacteria bacterium RIFCSPLOWO2_02_FULL_59_19]
MYTLDTNVVIYYLKKDDSARKFLEPLVGRGMRPHLSAISEAELYAHPSLSSEEASLIAGVVSALSVVPIDSAIAQTAGYLKGTYRIGLADALVAATALSTGTVLATRNVRDFQRISSLSLQKI